MDSDTVMAVPHLEALEFDLDKIYFEADTAALVAILSILLTALRYSVQFSFQEMAKLTDIPEKKRAKFSESFWKFTYYLFTTIWAWGSVYRADFYSDTSLCWKGWPNQQWTPSLRYFYITQLAFYLHSIVAHVTIEVRRKDYLQMLVHHVVTAMLICGAMYFNFFRIGAIVMFLHDINDVILEFSKMNQYRGSEGIAHIGLATLILSWTLTRIYLFPRKVIYSTLMESVHYLWDIVDNPILYLVTFNSLLITLYLLNIFWWSLMLRMIYRFVRDKDFQQDVREKDP